MPPQPQPPSADIAVGLVEQGGRFLVSRRPPGSHLAGLWEFPGGKVRPGEAIEDALRRELAEEVGIEIRAARLLHRQVHAYDDRTVALHFFLCLGASGTPEPREGQETRWVTAHELLALEVPEGNRRLLELLREQLQADD